MMGDLVGLIYEFKDPVLMSLAIGLATAEIGIYLDRREYEKKRDMILGGLRRGTGNIYMPEDD